jgi:hypothetical protein
VRYPAGYTAGREAWAAAVSAADLASGWRPPPGARYRVAIDVHGGGKRDLDRVCTAALDALQAGHAVRDDCLVEALAATRHAAPTRGASATTVEVSAVPPAGQRRGASGGRP